MKKRILSVLLVITMLTLMVACAKTNETGGQSAPTDNDTVVETTAPNDTVTPENSEAVNETVSEPDGEAVPETEAVHEHNYVENVVTEVTCTTDGTTSYTCECGDTYDETVPATGHTWGDYVANGDATYLADGTKTATCTGCGETDTIADDGSKLAYTYTDCEAVKYAQQTVNVRSGPSTDFDKVGSLSTNQEVTVTGTCNETGWYRIVYGDGVAYVSNKYLGDSKVEVSAPPADNGGGGNSNAPAGVPNPFTVERRVVHDMGTYRFIVCSYYDYDAIYKLNPCGAQGSHLNTNEDLWVWYECSNYSDPGYRAFIDTYTCNCRDADHNGLYPERLGN